MAQIIIGCLYFRGNIMLIKKIGESERGSALELILNVFMQFEAPDYSQEGIKTFERTVINNLDYLSSITIYGAYEEETLTGVIATRMNGCHVALFFVDGKHHRRGIGKKLFEAVLENTTSNKITVNAFPYAVTIYHHLGFVDSDVEHVEDGMRYTPMVYTR